MICRPKHSTPYDVIYLPEKKIVAASFKMQGNNILSFWDNSDANMIVAAGTSKKDHNELTYFPLGQQLPECLAWDPKTETLFITRVGFGDHAVTAVDFSRYPELKKKWEIQIGFEPNGLALNPDFSKLIVTGIEGLIATFNPLTGKELGGRKRIPLAAGVNTIDTYQERGSSNVYLAMVGKNIVEMNSDTGAIRYARVQFRRRSDIGCSGKQKSVPDGHNVRRLERC